MKLQFKREKFFQAFSLASMVVAVRDVKSVLQNIKMVVGNNQVLLMATDLELGIRIILDEDITIDEPGEIMLSTKLFRKIFQESTDSVLTLECDHKTIQVNGERTHYQLPILSTEDFPDVPVFNAEEYYLISRFIMRELIRRTVFAVDPGGVKYALGGVLFECSEGRISAVASDGRRLAHQEGNAGMVGNYKTKENTIFPIKFLNLIEKALGEEDVKIAVVENRAQVQFGNIVLNSQLLESQFPRWRNIIPVTTDKKRVNFLVGELLTAIRQAEIVASDKEPCVIFSFSTGKLKVEATGAEIGESTVDLPVDYQGDDIKIKMDPRFLVDFLRVLPAGETVALYLDVGKPVLFKTEDGYSYVVMPLV